MADGFSASPYVLPNMFGPPGQALDNYTNDLQRQNQYQYELDWRRQRQEDADLWRKINLINDLTSLDKHKTGSDVADATANNLMSNVYQKYTAAAKNMSPLELQANIQKEMSGIIGGADAMKADLLEADKQMAAIKQAMPELNHAQLYDIVRKDIVTRRLNDKGDDFRSPMEIQPPKIDLNNPETLSNYVVGDKALRDFFANPTGVDDTFVFKGSNYANTKYKGKITPWRKPNYDPSALHEGFLPGKSGEPKLLFRSTTIPSEAMPASQGKPFEVIEEDVFNNAGLSPMQSIQLTNAAKRMFPGYENFKPEEKKLAQRHVFLKYAQANDKTDFYPVDRNNPSASMIKVWAGGGGSGAGDSAIINDIHGRINKKIDQDISRGYLGTRFNSLANDEQGVIKQAVENAGYSVEEAGKNIFLHKEADGRIKIYKTGDDGQPRPTKEAEISELPFIGTNIGKQANVAGKKATVAHGNKTEPSAPPKKKVYKGLDSKGNPIFE